MTESDPRPPPPQLMFDDGSRIMQEAAASATSNVVTTSARAQSVSVHDYFEIDYLVKQIQRFPPPSRQKESEREDVWSHRVALQFPDELLHDAPAVCWALEEALPNALVFCLGDTTYAACCPDQVAAAHLEATCLVHFGHACLSPSNQIPVLYSFGRSPINVQRCVEHVVAKQAAQVESVERMLVLYDVGYHHAMEELQSKLEEENFHVTLGRIPPRATNYKPLHSQFSGCGKLTESCGKSSTESSELTKAARSSQTDCCKSQAGAASTAEECPISDEVSNLAISTCKRGSTGPGNFVVGGLELPTDLRYSDFVFLFIGDDLDRQYLNIVLRFLSGSGPSAYWVWNPVDESLVTELSPKFQRILNRRFYLVQKAKHSAVFGILVANLSDTRMREIVYNLRRLIQDHERVSYTLVVGKINPAKLANFAEIDCFVLVACPEHSLLEEDREFPVPVLTPLELSMALGVTDWGSVDYALDVHEYLLQAEATNNTTEAFNSTTKELDDESDAPYFSLVTGRYESAPTVKGQTEENVELNSLPGKGQLTTYHSAAAEYLKAREYQGLQVELDTKVQGAIAGEKGIASNYGNR